MDVVYFDMEPLDLGMAATTTLSASGEAVAIAHPTATVAVEPIELQTEVSAATETPESAANRAMPPLIENNKYGKCKSLNWL